jgi:hypothetical protein
MTQEQMQRKLNLIARHINELSDAVRDKWPDGYLFCECGESIHIMSALDEGGQCG